MTVASTSNRKTYAGDNVSTSFDTSPMVFFATTDLLVYVVTNATGGSTLLTSGTHYTASGGATPSPATGTVNLAGGSSPWGALQTGTTLLVVRGTANTQPTNFVNNDNSDAEAQEGALDRLALLVQQLQEGFNRALRYDVSDLSGATGTLPSFMARAGKFLGFDGSGVPVVGATVGGALTTTVIGQISFGAAANTLAQDANLFWDNLNKRLGVGNAAPTTTLDVTGTGKFSSSLVWGTGVASFGQVVKRKTVDETVTSSAVLQDDDHLTFSIAANEEWVACFEIDAGVALNTTGFKLALTVPSGATLNFVANQTDGSNPPSNNTQRTTTSGAALDYTTAFFGNPGPSIVSCKVWVLNGANAGSVTLQWCQSTSSGSALTFRKGSFMQAVRVA